MSETPDISMDLLELEDAVPPPDIGSVFLEEEGEEESPREEDDVAWTPFLGPNPMTEVEFLLKIFSSWKSVMLSSNLYSKYSEVL